MDLQSSSTLKVLGCNTCKLSTLGFPTTGRDAATADSQQLSSWLRHLLLVCLSPLVLTQLSLEFYKLIKSYKFGWAFVPSNSVHKDLLRACISFMLICVLSPRKENMLVVFFGGGVMSRWMNLGGVDDILCTLLKASVLTSST